MGTATGYTKEKMDEIIDATIIGGSIVSNNLILEKHDGSTVDAGPVTYTPPPLVATPAALQALETSDGREAFITPVSGQRWRLRYDQGQDRWDVVGFTPLTARVDGDITTTNASNTYSDMTDAGPSIALVFGGNYEVQVGCEMETGIVSVSHAGFMNYRKSSAAVPGDDLDAARVQIMTSATNVGGIVTTISPPGSKTYLAADTIEALYRDGSANFGVTFRKRWMRITPKHIIT